MSFAPCDVANSDKIPLAFSGIISFWFYFHALFFKGSESGKTIVQRGVDEVAVQESANWDKRMSIMLVTVSGNKANYVRPIIVFAGKGTRITPAERAALSLMWYMLLLNWVTHGLALSQRFRGL